ncbi:hypothetical protein BaRGS_00034845 [Batillaria attramentaria]|uniref:Ribosomal protein S10 n=1 Tax=Batillaria attramentaria TaxID=370345 RepID=A0ABD0JGN0_9CAEN
MAKEKRTNDKYRSGQRAYRVHLVLVYTPPEPEIAKRKKVPSSLVRRRYSRLRVLTEEPSTIFHCLHRLKPTPRIRRVFPKMTRHTRQAQTCEGGIQEMFIPKTQKSEMCET